MDCFDCSASRASSSSSIETARIAQPDGRTAKHDLQISAWHEITLDPLMNR
ncbi:hypothetical protein [Rhizobium johnstonii]|uniref:hypothetical protein n=1 Tax=Rhizobium johnstonii TaxID=3019933 RepID=UPI003F9CBCB6